MAQKVPVRELLPGEFPRYCVYCDEPVDDDAKPVELKTRHILSTKVRPALKPEIDKIPVSVGIKITDKVLTYKYNVYYCGEHEPLQTKYANSVKSLGCLLILGLTGMLLSALVGAAFSGSTTAAVILFLLGGPAVCAAVMFSTIVTAIVGGVARMLIKGDFENYETALGLRARVVDDKKSAPYPEFDFYNEDFADRFAEYVVEYNIRVRELLDKLGVSVEAITLDKTELAGADERGADLKGADLVGTNMEEANLEGTNLEGASLEGANLEGANLQFTNLQRANLRAANLHKANLNGAGLQEADLTGANLVRANLQKANLWKANLRGAMLLGADFREGSVWEANLEGAILEGKHPSTGENVSAIFDEETFIPDGVWKSDTDMTRFTDPDHDEFWRSDDPESPAYRGATDPKDPGYAEHKKHWPDG